MPFTHSMVPTLWLFSHFPTARRPSLRNTVRTPASFVSRELGRTECSQWIIYFNPMPLQHYPRPPPFSSSFSFCFLLFLRNLHVRLFPLRTPSLFSSRLYFFFFYRSLHGLFLVPTPPYLALSPLALEKRKKNCVVGEDKYILCFLYSRVFSFGVLFYFFIYHFAFLSAIFLFTIILRAKD